MESKFKVGDKVYCVDDSGYHNTAYLVKGSIYTVVDAYWFECKSGEVSIRDTTEYPEDFKLYKEEPVKQFDMKTQPWFIRINNEREFYAAEEWLKENFGCNLASEYKQYFKAITNADNYGKVFNNRVMWTENPSPRKRHEIKLHFKTIIDSVEWPIVESEKDKKIRELKETIEAAAKQIKELEEM